MLRHWIAVAEIFEYSSSLIYVTIMISGAARGAQANERAEANACELGDYDGRVLGPERGKLGAVAVWQGDRAELGAKKERI